MQISYSGVVTNATEQNELLERIAACEAPVRAWALDEGHKNLKARIESQAAIASQAAATLTLLLAGIGGSLVYAVRIFEPGSSPVARGAAALCIYLMALAGVLIWRCINTTASPVLHNEPTNLLLSEATLEQLQAGEIFNLQQRIDQQKALVVARARWLNGVRVLAILSPIIFAAFATT